MMKQEIKEFTLNDCYFTVSELVKFCMDEVGNKTEPKWKLDVYRFILDFLSDSEFISQETSGSAGTPKSIQLSKQAMLKSAENTISFFQLEKGHNAVLCLPVKYIAGKMMVVRAFLTGINLILIEPAGTPDFSKLVEIDFCAMVPIQAANLLKQNKWPDIKTLIIGGAETNPELAEKLQKVKTKVFETYGMAETCSHVALKRINGENREPGFSVLPGVKISTDERDCLVIEVPFLNEKVVTNDVVELLSENKFRWIGRFDSIINSGGLKIQPEILEKQMEKILEMPCAVIGMSDSLLGQKIVLILETENEVEPEKILAKLSTEIERKSLPKLVFTVKKFPQNKSFKIDRLKLKSVISNLV